MTSHPQNAPATAAPQVAIIGGGITGLSAGWYLQKAGIPFTLLEKEDRTGGKIQTTLNVVVCDMFPDDDDCSFTIEHAADAFLAAQKPWALDLAIELGMEEYIQNTNRYERSVCVVHNGTLEPFPAGLQLIIPTNAEALRATSLLSAEGKERMLAEASIPQRTGSGDESVADFVTRRFGPEALEAFAEPLLSGIYNANPTEQSLHATFPRFAQMEQEHGSLIKAAQKRREKMAGMQPGQQNARTPFISFRGGTEDLVRTLHHHLKDSIKTASDVVSIERENEQQYRLVLADGTKISAAHILLTAPAVGAAKLLRDIAPETASNLDSLRTVSTGIIHLAYQRNVVDHPLDGFGVVIPRREKRQINAITWTSSKFAGRAPKGWALLRVFFGGVRTPQTMALDDEALLTTVRSELRELMGIDAEPLFKYIYRWQNAQPQYDVGHRERMARIHRALPTNLYLAGSPYGGVGIPDCVRQGKEIAERIYDC